MEPVLSSQLCPQHSSLRRMGGQAGSRNACNPAPRRGQGEGGHVEGVSRLVLLQLGVGVVVDVVVAGGEGREVGGEVDQVRVLLLSPPVRWSLAGEVVVIPAKLVEKSAFPQLFFLLLRVIRSRDCRKRRRPTSRLLHTQEFLESQLKRLEELSFKPFAQRGLGGQPATGQYVVCEITTPIHRSENIIQETPQRPNTPNLCL